jgi:hypothetical protein
LGMYRGGGGVGGEGGCEEGSRDFYIS